ncbi:hypothetical protein [Vibrio campbellii]|uniref:hypothetical protein n=1 Tax=Vibrio campbellii TaxID=680 RepID=UPI0030D7F0E4
MKLTQIQDKYDAEIIAVVEKLAFEIQGVCFNSFSYYRIEMHHFGPDFSYPTPPNNGQ